MKRDTAYHGDAVIAQEGFFTESIGTYLVKGKETAVEIYSISVGC